MWRPQTKEAVLREVRIREWRSQVARKFVRFLNRIGQVLVQGTLAILGWLRWQAGKTAQEVEVSQLLSQKYDKLLQLGELTYAMFCSGNRSWTALEPLCEEIANVDRKLEQVKTAPLHVLTGQEEPLEQQPTINIAESR